MSRQLPLLTRSSLAEILHSRFNGDFLTLKDLPLPYTFKDMEKAVKRIAAAIKNGERIALIGDYDVDGVVSTATIRKFFSKIDYPLQWIIPNRFKDGYGLSAAIIPRIEDADLLITVDNGIAAHEAARICKEKGIDLIITDHHNVPEIIPEAYAIVNQKQNDCSFPYEEVCGAQIAWYLCAALAKELGKVVNMKDMLEITALAIVADVMPLQHINRTMLIAGMQILERSNTPFIVAYRNERNKEKLGVEDISFGLAPLLNSAGRLEDASIACDFLCSETIAEAKSKLEYLNTLNNRRKSVEQEITDAASAVINIEDPILLAVGEGWHEGVVGIAAARLSMRYERPAIVLSCEGEICKGSGRSWGNCDLFSLLDEQRSIMEKFGGHRAAVGLSIKKENLNAFHQALKESAGQICRDEDYYDPSLIGELPFSEIDFDLMNIIDRYEPYGESNPRPKFKSSNVEVVQARAMGNEGQHSRYLLRQNGWLFNAVQFRSGGPSLSNGDKAEIIYNLNLNNFNGNISIQLMIDKIYKL